MRRLLIILICIIQVVLAIQYNYSVEDFIFLFVNLIGTFYFLNHIIDVKSSLSTCLLYAFIFLSLSVEALLRLEAGSFSLSMGGNPDKAFEGLAIFSNRVLLLFYISFAIFNTIINRKKKDVIIKRKSYFHDSLFVFLLIFSFGISVYSGIVGIGKMGFEAKINLPFHLNGMIQFFRTDIFPLIIAIYVYDKLSLKRSVSSKFIILIILWAILESFVRLSRSASVFSFLPLFFMLLYADFFRKKDIARLVIPILGLGLLLFPIISLLRNDGDVSVKTITEASNKTNEEGSTISHAYLRTFISGIYYSKMYSQINNDPSEFYFGRAPMVIMLGGSAVYTTRVIDGVSENVVHSSGTTGILDPLIIGGHGLCYLMIFFLTILSLHIDRRVGANFMLYKVLSIMIFFVMIMKKNLTLVLDSESIQCLSCYIFQYFIISYYYKKCFKKRKVEI